jgi:RNA polymerase sigma-70 factor (ECF subfamily)
VSRRSNHSQVAPAAGRVQSFRDLYSEQSQYMWRTLRRLGVRAADQEDLLQEVFLRAVRSLASLDPDLPVRPWLFGIAFRVVSDFRRLSRHRVEVLRGSLEAPDQAPAPAEAYERAESCRLLHLALQQVPLERRALLLMFYFDEYTMAEIADVFPMPVQTLYTRLRRARQELLEALKRLESGQKS